MVEHKILPYRAALEFLMRSEFAESIYLTSYLLKNKAKNPAIQLMQISTAKGKWIAFTITDTEMLYIIGHHDRTLIDSLSGSLHNIKHVIGTYSIAVSIWKSIQASKMAKFVSHEKMYRKAIIDDNFKKLETYPHITQVTAQCKNLTPYLNLYKQYLTEIKLPTGEDESINQFLTTLSEYGHLWVIQNEKRALGMIFINNFDEKRAHLAGMYIAPDFRKKHYGLALLRGVENHLVSKYTELTLNTAVSNFPAIALYSKYGFKRAGDLLFAISH